MLQSWQEHPHDQSNISRLLPQLLTSMLIPDEDTLLGAELDGGSLLAEEEVTEECPVILTSS